MAWGGLTDHDPDGDGVYTTTPWFKELVPNADDRARVRDIIAIEQSGKNLEGVSQTQKGKDGGC